MTTDARKEPLRSYEDFARVFAELYAKHAAPIERARFTCYVRVAIKDYVWASKSKRGDLVENGGAEDACGYAIARALLAQGMHPDTIVDHVDTAQSYVDNAERQGGDSVEAMEKVSAHLEPCLIVFANSRNRARYMWALAGCPEL